MADLLRGVQDVFDQLDPFSLGNRIVYFSWLALYSFTLVVVWRSRHAWVRFLCFVLNQVLSVGVVISWSMTVLLAYTYWVPSLMIFVTIAGGALYLFRGRKP